MNILIIILSILLIPISAFSTDWNHKGQFGEINKYLKCLDSNNCFSIHSVTSVLYVYHSSNQGKDWNLRYKSVKSDDQKPPYIYNPRSVSIPDTNNIFITYWDNFVINKSTDGGRSFDKILIIDTLNEGAADINMYNSLFGYLIFWPKLYITNDGWKSWEIKDNLNKSSIRNATFINNNEIQYYRITEENVSFSKYNFLTNQVDDLYSFYKNYKQDTSAKNTILNICYLNNNIIYATGGRATGFGDTRRDIIYKTTDGGHDWEKVHDSLYGYPFTEKGTASAFGLQDIACYDENNCMAVGAYGKVVMTKDGGKTWAYHPEGEFPFYRNKEMDGPLVMHVVWAGKTPIVSTFSGNIYRYEGDFFDFGTSVEDTQLVSTSIFPNPSSDKISVDLGGVAVADLVVYDILGNEIMSIPNYTNKSEIDISNLSIGTYTIQVQTITVSISQRLLVNR